MAGRRGSRRRFLGLAGAGLVAAGVGCTGGGVTPTAAPAGAGVATAAAPGAAPAATPTAAARQPKRGGTFRWGSSTLFDHLDPHQTTSAAAFGFAVGVCWSRLLKFKIRDVELPAFIPVGDLAESWEQPDDVTYVFKLRRNAKWQNVAPANGRAVTADDILYSYARQRTQGFPNSSILAAVARAEAVDPYTLKITADKPAADFLLALAAPQSVIVSRELVEQKGDLREGPMIGTGPFILEKTDRAGTNRAVRNPDYFIAGQPYVDAYECYSIPDMAGQNAAFRSDNVDMIPSGSPTVPDAEAVRRAKPGAVVQMVKALGSGTELALKLDRKPFDDPRVRRAIYRAFDPQAVIDTAYSSGWLTVGLPLPGVDWAIPQAEMATRYKRDLDLSRRLLREAGFENGLDMNIVVFNASFFPTAAEFIAAQLAEANIRAKLELIDGATYAARVRGRGEFEAAIGTSAQYASADSALFSRYHSKGVNNVFPIRDDRLDQMIDRQTTLGRDPAARKQLLLEIQRYILDQHYVHYFHTYDSPVILQSYVRDFTGGFGALNLEGDKWSHVWLDK
jgi:peptide/nickel transport system substrate-binding protein